MVCLLCENIFYFYFLKFVLILFTSEEISDYLSEQLSVFPETTKMLKKLFSLFLEMHSFPGYHFIFPPSQVIQFKSM